MNTNFILSNKLILTSKFSKGTSIPSILLAMFLKALAANESPLYTRGSPLFYASEKGYTEIVEILLLAGAE